MIPKQLSELNIIPNELGSFLGCDRSVAAEAQNVSEYYTVLQYMDTFAALTASSNLNQLIASNDHLY